MPVFAAPAFLLAGALAALVPLALHLIRRRPPLRAPLPTARFLSPDPRNAVRVSRPTDVPLLLLRMAMLLLLGLGLARPAWVPASSGTAPLVLLDRSIPADAWPGAVDGARSALLGAEGAARGGLVVFDTSASVIPAARLDSALFDSLAALAPAPSGDLAAGLRAIGPAVRALPRADSVRVRLVSAFTDAGWSSGLGAVRSAAWPGAIELARVAGGPRADSLAGAPSRSAVVVAREGGDLVAAALGAMGYGVARAIDGGASPGVVVFVDGRPGDSELAALVERGSTVVVPAAGSATAGGGGMWFGADLRLEDAGARLDAPAAPGARLLAAWEDGGVAATARRVGAGCVVEVRTGLEDGALPFQAAYPAAVGRLARGCEDALPAARPLDAGALALLGGRGAGAVAAATLAPERAGTALGRWILLAALAAALAETWIAYGRRTAG